MSLFLTSFILIIRGIQKKSLICCCVTSQNEIYFILEIDFENVILVRMYLNYVFFVDISNLSLSSEFET